MRPEFCDIAAPEAGLESLSLPLLMDSTFGKEPPERKEGHSDRSSGKEVEFVPMNDRIAAA